MHLLTREERIELKRKLKILRPKFLKSYVPDSFWKKRPAVQVLLVCDGKLNFGMEGFGLSEFLNTFNELERILPIDYKVTLAHRRKITRSSNRVVVNHISDFNFATSVNLNDFDQMWLFGIESKDTEAITSKEKDIIQAYMNRGGGLFATGDHGRLGKAMCGDIIRIKDMRYWDDTHPDNDKNRVSMDGKVRHDTNRPADGHETSLFFDNQSDNIPQTIAATPFGAGKPHSLLSIRRSLRPSGVIDIMPDHPHEGECKVETSFTVNGVTIPTQIIATSFVLAGSTTKEGAGKALTIPHCFPSISVWDGRWARAGRIVIDSTWHHFVNENLDGTGTNRGGLEDDDFKVIQHYYMNIAIWISRHKSFLAWHKHIIFDLFADSKIIEASLNNPNQAINDISLADLNSIGALAEEILASKYNPAFARSFLLEIMEDCAKGVTEILDIWKPNTEKKGNEYYQKWLNYDLILWTSIGAGFIALRDDEKIASTEGNEKELERVVDVFVKGMGTGFNSSMDNLNANFKSAMNVMK